jgi:hypothetical protein
MPLIHPRRAALLLTALLLSLAAASHTVPAPSAAQTADLAPLVVTLDGDIHTYSPGGDYTRLTTRTDAQKDAHVLTDEDAQISPDGRYLLYREMPQFYADARVQNRVSPAPEEPTDLILLDLQSGDSTLLATHPADANIMDPFFIFYRGGTEGRGMTFAPDSSQLAYTERRGSCAGTVTFCTRAMVYDISSGESRDVALSDDPLLDLASWGEAGLVVRRTVYNDAGTVTADNRYLSDIATPVPYHLYAEGSILQPVDQFGVPEANPVVYAFDLLNDRYRRFPGFISKVSQSDPASSLILIDYDNTVRPRAVYRNDGERLYFPDGNAPFTSDFVLSPDGQSFAFSLSTGVFEVYDNSGTLLDAPNGQVLAWGAMHYTVAFSDGSLSTAQDTARFEDVSACGPLNDVGLTPGGVGYMRPGNARIVRSEPRAGAPQVGTIPGDVTFAVVDGQQNVCNGGFRWAQIAFGGVQGWTAQGASRGGGIYMEAR